MHVTLEGGRDWVKWRRVGLLGKIELVGGFFVLCVAVQAAVACRVLQLSSDALSLVARFISFREQIRGETLEGAINERKNLL